MHCYKYMGAYIRLSFGDVAGWGCTLMNAGQLIEVNHKERRAMARMFIALDEGDYETISKIFTEIGCTVKDKKNPGRAPNPPDICAHLLLMQYGGAQGLKKAMTFFGCTSMAEINVKLDDLIEMSGANIALTMVQRCCFCLQGVGAGVGCPGINVVPLLRPSAETTPLDHR